MINFYENNIVMEFNRKFIEENLYILDFNFDTNKCIDNMSKYKNYDSKNQTIILLNVEKINSSWLKSDNYINNFNLILNENVKAKYIQSRIDMINCVVKKPPYIYMLNENIEFENGRNRFANLRDLGVKFMPFIVYKKDLVKIKNICV